MFDKISKLFLSYHFDKIKKVWKFFHAMQLTKRKGTLEIGIKDTSSKLGRYKKKRRCVGVETAIRTGRNMNRRQMSWRKAS